MNLLQRICRNSRRWLQRGVRPQNIIVLKPFLPQHRSQSFGNPCWEHPQIHNNKMGTTTAGDCLTGQSPGVKDDTAFHVSHNKTDKTGSRLASPNIPLFCDTAYESEACYKAAKKQIRVGQEAAIWIAPLISYLACLAANQILNPRTLAEWLTISIPLCLLSPCLSILVAAAWTILVVSWYFPCAMWPNDQS